MELADKLRSLADIIENHNVDLGKDLEAWLAFLHSFALSDHLGDASECVRNLALVLGLPIPPGDYDFEDWIKWVEDNGVNYGISHIILRNRGEK